MFPLYLDTLVFFLSYGFLFLTRVWGVYFFYRLFIGWYQAWGSITNIRYLVPQFFFPFMCCGVRWKFFPIAPSLFVSVFYQYDEEEDSGVSVFTIRVVMSMIVLILYEALISFTLVVSLKISVNHANHLLFILQFSGSVSLIHF